MHAPIQGPCLGPTQLQAARSAEVGIYGDQDDFALVLLEDADGETIQLTEDSGWNKKQKPIQWVAGEMQHVKHHVGVT